MADLDPSRLVFVDETWIKTNMAPLRGWGAKGERLKGYAPHGHWRTLTFIAALRCDRLTAPCVFDGPINGKCFRACVDQQLIATLKPGDIVILDNLGSYKAKAVRQTIRQRVPGYGSCRRIAGSEPHPAGICQDQTLDEDRSEARHRRNLAPSRKAHRHNRPKRMRQLHRKCRLCFNQTLTWSRARPVQVDRATRPPRPAAHQHDTLGGRSGCAGGFAQEER